MTDRGETSEQQQRVKAGWEKEIRIRIRPLYLHTEPDPTEKTPIWLCNPEYNISIFIPFSLFLYILLIYSILLFLCHKETGAAVPSTLHIFYSPCPVSIGD